MRRGARAVVAAACAGVLVAAGLAAGPARAGFGPANAPAPSDLAVDGLANQLAAATQPRFSWLPHSGQANDVQTAYQLVVADARNHALVWDSGRVASSAQAVAGPHLEPGRPYAWTVRTWNRAGVASPYAPPVGFDTALGDADWSGAQWIRRVTTGHDSTIDYTLARGDFTVGSVPVRRARAYVAAEGLWQLHVDGRVVDTQYDYAMPGEGFYTAEDITRFVTPGPLAVGVKYAAWPTTNGAGRPEGPVPVTTTLASAAAAGASTLQVKTSKGLAVRENIAVGWPGAPNFDIVTIAAVHGGALTLVTPLPHTHGANANVVSENGPSGLLVKVVVEHTDGSVQTFVSDGSWRVRKDASEDNTVVSLRSQEDAGSYVEYVDARRAALGWDQVGYDDSGWQPAAPMGAHPLPNPTSCANYLDDSTPCGFTHLVPMQSGLTYGTARPARVQTLRDGTVVADFGSALVGIPVVHLHSGAAGRHVTLVASYRLTNTTLTAPALPLTSTIAVHYPCRFHRGDPVTVDAPADGYGAGDPEQRTVIATTASPSCLLGTIMLDAPLRRAHAAGRWVQGARVGTSPLDTQATNLSFHYTETAGDQQTTFFVGQGFRYLQISGAHEPLTANDIWVTTTHEDAPGAHAATFVSSNPTLNAVFALMQRSALYAGQQEFNDSPDRQDGQFLGDAVNESFATMESLDERALTRQAIAEFAFSQLRYWPAGRLNAVYPTGDGKRDIPDFTEMYPEWVWRYYWLTGDTRTLAFAYPTMQRVARYVAHSIATSGPAAGLVYELVGGNSRAYRHGIVDWPQPMRYDTTVLNKGVDTVVNLRAVEVFRALADSARALGRSGDAAAYDRQTRALTRAINTKLIEPSGYYDDGLLPDTGTQIGNHSEHDQSFAVTYGVAPAPSHGRLGDYFARQGMKQGPLDLGQLEQALIDVGRPDVLVSMLTDPTADGPAKILTEGGTSMWEQWNPGCMIPGGHPGNTTVACVGPMIIQQSHESFSHGWGSVGIVGILRGLLGITVTSPGAATVAITPPASGLRAARGTEWTERGPVSVDWTKNASGYAVTVDVPDNVTATVTVPGHPPVVVGSGRTMLPAG